MSVSSCEVEHARTSSGSDFYCTEEELFDSFMEIVNDPELQDANNSSHSDAQEENLGQNGNEACGLDKCSLNNKENEASVCNSSSALCNTSEHVEIDTSKVASGSFSKSDDGVLDQGNSEGSATDNDNNETNVEQNDFNLTNGAKSEDSTGELDKLIENIIDTSNCSKHVGNGKLDEKVDGADSLDQVSDLSRSENNNFGLFEERQMHSTENNEHSLDIDLEQNVKNEQTQEFASSPVLANHNEGEIVLANQSEAETAPANQDEESTPPNKNEVEIAPANQVEVDATSTNQDEAETSSANQCELKSIENNIEEGIRQTNQVCEELNAIMQRLSRSSDELLGDGDAQITSENEYGNLSENNDISIVEPPNSTMNSQTGENKETNDTLSSEDPELEDKQIDTEKNNETSVDLKPTKETSEKRPNTLPTLIVTNQTSKSTPLPIGLHSASTPPNNSPSRISPTQLIHLNDDPPDRKHSMSDSVDSSEGSVSGDTKSVGTPPEVRGPIDWDILNSAFEHPDTDEDDGMYESSGKYGGFGIVLDEEAADTVSQLSTIDKSADALSVNDSRFRSVSQSSTISEVEFQEEYKKTHSIGSLERKIDGVLFSGYLLKLGGTGITPKNWRKRWCVLRQDRCLYYYKGARDKVPCGIVVLANYIISHSSECNKKNCIKISKGGARTYFFSADSSREMLRWMEVLRQAADNKAEEGTSFVIRNEIIHNVAIPALSIKKPDCHGYLTKQGGKSTRSWKRRYCVLKNGCLYYYREMADTTALGVAKLHGYTVDEVSITGRRNGFRCVPPNSRMRTFTFVADNEYDKKRWVPCFRESIRVNTPSDK